MASPTTAEVVGMGQEAASSGSFGIRCVTNKIIEISFSNKGEERAESETSL